MDVCYACQNGCESLRARVLERVRAFSPGKGRRWWAAGLVPVATSFVILAAVAAPASGATSRSGVAAPAGVGEALDETAVPSELPAPDTAAGAVSTPAPEVAAAAGPQIEANAAESAPDIAQTGAVSPAVAHGPVVEEPAIAVDNTVVAEPQDAAVAPSQPAETASASGTGRVEGDASQPATSQVAAPLAVAKHVAVQTSDRVTPSGWRYRSGQDRYRAKKTVDNISDEISQGSTAKSLANPTRNRDVIPLRTCTETSCETQPGTAPSEPTDATVDPSAGELISSLLGQIGGTEGCGNTNVSFRVSSPGEDGSVTQTVAAGECGRNIVVTIRINSPGDNGPVSQTVDTVDAIIEHFSSLVHAARQRQLGLAQIGSQPGNPVVTVNPATLPRQLERSAQRLAWTLVARAQARANRALPQAARPRARARPRATTQSRSSVRVRASVRAVASASVTAGSTKVSARVSIKTSNRAKRTRATTRGASLTVPQSSEGRLTASPVASQAGSAGGSGSGREAVLFALLAALVGAYLLVPPLRSERALGISRWWAKRGLPR